MALFRNKERIGGSVAFAGIKRQYLKVASILTFISMIGFYFRTRLPFASQRNGVTAMDMELERSLAANSGKSLLLDANGYVDLNLASRYCGVHGWNVFPHRESRRKIYDLVMINTELDWLEIRLNELQDHVDYFIVLESGTTFTGLPKNLTLSQNWARFQKFSSKIIYHLLENPPNSTNSWDHEIHQRNAMFTQVLPSLKGRQSPNQGDVILVSDLDEIPRPATLTLLRNCDFPKRLTLRSRFYYYGFQWLHRGPEWAHPQATTYAGANGTILPQDLRHPQHTTFFDRDKADLWNAAWHCSSCFAAIDEVLGKMKSFSHTELNKEKFREKKRIVDRIRHGKDLWDRWGQNYDRVENNQDVPSYLKTAGTRERFQYMLNRDGENAGFVDYKPEDEDWSG